MPVQRTAQDIIKSLTQSLKRINPSIDAAKGPVRDIFLEPVAPEILDLEDRQNELEQFLTFDRASIAVNEDLITALANNMLIASGTGSTSKGLITFYRSTRPPDTEGGILIPEGTLVGTSGGTYIYQTTESITMDATSASAYYNADTRRYEISVGIEAIAVGPEYDLPSYRIVSIITPLTAFDGCVNYTPTEGGEDASGSEELVTKISLKLQGIDLGSPGGIAYQVTLLYPNEIDSVAVIPGTNPLFRRRVTEPGLDVYVAGNINKTITETFTVTDLNGQNEFSLTNVPVQSVSQVLVDGVSQSGWAFSPDTTLEHKESALADDKIVFGYTVNQNQTVTVTYTYDSIIGNIQKNITDNNALFGSDLLTRQALTCYAWIEMSVKVVNSYDRGDTLAEVENYLISLINSDDFGKSTYPENIRNAILQNVPGVSRVSITTFTRSDTGAAGTVETINAAENEITMLDMDKFNIRT